MNAKFPHERPWRVGVIGAGRIVERAHVPILTHMPEVIIVGLFDPDQDRAHAIAQEYGIPRVCHSLEALLDLNLAYWQGQTEQAEFAIQLVPPANNSCPP